MPHLARSVGTPVTVQRDESDEALMVRYQKGDVRAFELLLGRHRKPVFNFILRFVRDPATAEDLLQESSASARASPRSGHGCSGWPPTSASIFCGAAARGSRR